MKYVCVLSLEYCMDHWKEDRFFGYQCLNGSNPRMIQRCKKLPKNFPVEPNMVQSSMANGTSLDKELKVEEYCQYDLLPNVTNRNKKHLQNAFIGLFVQLMLSSFHVRVFHNVLLISAQAGNIYLLDYAIMDGLPTNTIRGKLQYIAAPLCLLYQHPDEGLIPIAIQVYHSHPSRPLTCTEVMNSTCHLNSI